MSGAASVTAPMLYTRPVIAVLYDVHGNLGALDAVLGPTRGGAGASRAVIGGDYALFGAWQAETVARLRELEPATWIRGNVDRWAGGDVPGESHLAAAVEDTRAALGDTLADELGRAAGRGRGRRRALRPRLAGVRHALVRPRARTATTRSC